MHNTNSVIGYTVRIYCKNTFLGNYFVTTNDVDVAKKSAFNKAFEVYFKTLNISYSIYNSCTFILDSVNHIAN